MPFGLDFYTDLPETTELFRKGASPETPISERHRKLGKKIAKVIDNFSLVNFIPLCVDD
jgi:hypothetical protein